MIRSKVVVPLHTTRQRSIEDNVDQIHTATIHFEEGDEIINMEINDGGAAAREFASGEDMETEDNSKSENDQASDSDTEPGEILEPPEMDDYLTDNEEVEQTYCDSPQRVEPSTSSGITRVKKPSAKMRRVSMEEKIDSLSSTLSAVQELLVQNGLSKLPDNKGLGLLIKMSMLHAKVIRLAVLPSKLLFIKMHWWTSMTAVKGISCK